MPLDLCQIELSDGPAVADIYGKCFADTTLYTVLHPNIDATALSDDFLSRWEGMFTNPQGFYIGVKDTDTDTNTLVAFTRYMKVNIPLSETEQEALRRWKRPVKAKKNWSFESFFQSELQAVIENDGRLQENRGRPQLCKFVSLRTSNSSVDIERHKTHVLLPNSHLTCVVFRVRSGCYIARISASGCG